jgi:hypothetical protein
LAANTTNRPVSKAVVRSFAQAMRRGEWMVTHQGIAFSGVIVCTLLRIQTTFCGLIPGSAVRCSRPAMIAPMTRSPATRPAPRRRSHRRRLRRRQPVETVQHRPNHLMEARKG